MTIMSKVSFLKLTLGGVKYKDGNDMPLEFYNKTVGATISINSYSKKGDKEVCVPESRDILVTPKTIRFHRKVGEHNTIKADLNVKVLYKFDVITKTTEDTKFHASMFFALKEFFKSENVTLDRCKGGVYGNNGSHLAEKYRVVNVCPENNGYDNIGCIFNVTLDIFSWDILLDKTRYSRAYTAKRLGEDIMKKMVDESGVKSQYDIGNLQFLSYVKDSTSKAKDEYIQPYLVQYNETDYEFLLRNANRCGEFFYFEYGKLHLGLSAGSSILLDKAEIRSVPCSVQPNDKAGLFYQNAVKSTSSGTIPDKPFVAEYSNNDYFATVEKGKYDNADDWKGLYPDIPYRVLSEVFQMDKVDAMSVFDVVNGSVLKVNQLANTFSEKGNKNFDGKYFPGTIPTSTQYSSTGNEYSPFSDLYGKKTKLENELKKENQPSTENFFKNANREAEVAQQQYSVFETGMDNSYWLGQIVEFNGVKESTTNDKKETIYVNKKFVVVQIDYECVYVEAELRRNITVITVIPKGNMPMPLPANVPHVLKAGAQPAVVVDASDPKRLGRVRVRYNWQQDESDATPWIRVTTPFSTCKPKSKDGADDTGDVGAGMFCQLNKGDDVMVDYEGGNIERPFVVGSLYGGNRQKEGRKVPFGGRNYSHVFRSRYGHTIGIREPNSANTFMTSFMPGLSLFGFIPGFSGMLGAEPSEKLRQSTGGFDICDNNGMYSISTSSDARCISIDSPFGSVKINAAMGITVSAPNGNIRLVGKNIDIVAGNNLTLKSGENISNSFLTGALPSYINDSSKTAGQKVGDFFADRLGKPIAESLVGAFNIPGIRFIIELLVKPIQGTLKIHSNRHLMLEAGGKSAAMPANTFKSPFYLGVGNRFSDFRNLRADILIFLSYVKKCLHIYVEVYKSGQKQKLALIAEINNFEDHIGDLESKTSVEQWLDGKDAPDIVTIGKAIYGNGFSNDWSTGDEDKKKKYSNVVKVRDEITKLRNKIASDSITPLFPDVYDYKDDKKDDWKPHTKVSETKYMKDTTAEIKKYSVDLSVPNSLDKFFDKEVIRKRILGILDKYISTGNNNERQNKLLNKEGAAVAVADAGWNGTLDQYTLNKNYDDDHSFREYMRKDIGLGIANKLFPVDTIQFLATWDPESKGQILYSYPDKPNRLLGDDANECAGNDTDFDGLMAILRGPLF